ncbi:Rrf2 family transcriptional regulator [Hirschia baltica]|uniref:Transcriptional regulator, BadM/Rrf2 family n=1 Tax=Hirschia baltica (strain ATCC 49814 / DSM 5838 / IFAM 1418) TaxID=582402 RepID=C6XJ36_HIRBI|nr:Rrf2 family transcriptional regulator [Hirschia baltica]ACT59131.1 transcriptional regulator, BadM/Rrf2 family [Hirschia baltica ATCC 49814]
MKLGSRGRYAVMALVDLASNDMDGPVSLSDIAERQKISLSYLEQLFAKLRKANIVKSVRGPGGGYLLLNDASKTMVSQIIVAVDEPIQTTRCGEMGGKPCTGRLERCATHDLWRELRLHIIQFLSGVSISDVLSGNVKGMSGVLERL